MPRPAADKKGGKRGKLGRNEGKEGDIGPQSGKGNNQFDPLRRNDEEIRHLIVLFKQAIKAAQSTERAAYFWPNEDLLSEMLLTIAYDVPSNCDPLQVDDVDNEEMSEFLKEDFETRIRKLKCVEWLGLVNKVRGFAAAKLSIPGTYEPWVTYVNRLIVFLFAALPDQDVIQDFDNILRTKPGEPLRMKCRNPRCVKLSHIQLGRINWEKKGFNAAGSSSRPNYGISKGFEVDITTAAGESSPIWQQKTLVGGDRAGGSVQRGQTSTSMGSSSAGTGRQQSSKNVEKNLWSAGFES